MKLNETGRDGVLRSYEIIGDEDIARKIVKSITTYSIFKSESGITGSCSKADLHNIIEQLEGYNSSMALRCERPRYEEPVRNDKLSSCNVCGLVGISGGYPFSTCNGYCDDCI